MTVAIAARNVSYTTTGASLGPFAVPFQFFEIDVYLDGVLVSPSEYNITQSTTGGTGSITFTSTEPDGELAIYGATEAKQETNYADHDSFPAETHEQALDRLTMAVQELQAALNQALVVTPQIERLSEAQLNTVATQAYVDSQLANLETSFYRPIEKFVTDYGAIDEGEDHTAVINAAIADLEAGDLLVFPSLTYNIDGGIVIDTDFIGIRFDNAVIYVGETAARVSMVQGGDLKCGIMFQGVSRLKVDGSFRMIGTGTLGTTTVCGIVFDQCTYVQAPCSMFFENMALGRLIYQTTRSQFGDVYGHDMDGLQITEIPPVNTAGSVEVIAGCDTVTTGNAVGTGMAKPVRYMSIGTGAFTNAYIKTGASICHAGPQAHEAGHALAIRSATDCVFGPVITYGAAVAALYGVQYAGDQALGAKIDRVYVDSVLGLSPSTSSSIDALIVMESQDAGDIGTISVGHVEGDCDAVAGLYLTSGNLIVGTARLTGSAIRMIFLAGTTTSYKPYLSVGHLTIVEPGGVVAPVNIGYGGRLHIGHLDLWGGPGVNGIEAVRFDSTIGHSGHGGHYGVTINTINYTRNGTAGNYADLVFDSLHSAEEWRIWHIQGQGSTAGQALFASDRFFFIRGQMLSTSFPVSSKPYNRGTIIWNLTPSAGGAPGWVCVASGNPGTWKTMANLAA